MNGIALPAEPPEPEVGVVVSAEWPEGLDAELASRADDVEAGRWHSLENVLGLLRG